MVTSLVDMWTIADLNHSFKQKGVKEQRVDGSSKSRNLDFVRCTLVAGKPVLGRRIHSISDNSIIKNTRFMYTTKHTFVIKFKVFSIDNYINKVI